MSRSRSFNHCAIRAVILASHRATFTQPVICSFPLFSDKHANETIREMRSRAESNELKLTNIMDTRRGVARRRAIFGAVRRVAPPPPPPARRPPPGARRGTHSRLHFANYTLNKLISAQLLTCDTTPAQIAPHIKPPLYNNEIFLFSANISSGI